MTEPSYLTDTRSGYDAIAVHYAEGYRSALEAEPLGRALLGAFAELVLAPGSHLLLAFQVGDQPLHFAEAFDAAVSLDFRRLSPDRVEGLLVETGFDVVARLLREPDASEKVEKVPQALLARRLVTPGRVDNP